MLTWVILHSQIKKLWNRFDRDRMVKRVMKKFVMKFWLYALRFRRKIKRYGQTLTVRNHKMLQCHISATCLIFKRESWCAWARRQNKRSAAKSNSNPAICSGEAAHFQEQQVVRHFQGRSITCQVCSDHSYADGSRSENFLKISSQTRASQAEVHQG